MASKKGHTNKKAKKTRQTPAKKQTPDRSDRLEESFYILEEIKERTGATLIRH